MALAFYLGACWSLWCLGRAGSTLGAGHALRTMCDVAGTALVGTRHSHGGLVGRDPADEPAEVPDEALVDAALWHLLGPVLVHQLAGQHHAAVGPCALRRAYM